MGCVTIDPSDFDDRLEENEEEDNIFAHGGRSWIVRIFRFLVALSIVGILITFGILLLSKYNMTNVRVVSKLRLNQSPFPVVTLCNLNPYKSSMIGNFPRLVHLNEQFDKMPMAPDQQQYKKLEGAADEGVEEVRVKRLMGDVGVNCACDHTNEYNMVESTDDMLVWVAKSSETNWTCDFECCVEKRAGEVRRTSDPKLNQDEIDFLRRAGMTTKIDENIGGQHCTHEGDSCFAREEDGKRKRASKAGKMCKICKQHTRPKGMFVSRISVIYSRRMDVYYITDFFRGKPSMPLCRVGDPNTKRSTPDRSSTTAPPVDSKMTYQSESNDSSCSTCSSSSMNFGIKSTNGSSAVVMSTDEPVVSSPMTVGSSQMTPMTTKEDDDETMQRRAPIANQSTKSYMGDETARSANAYDMVPYIMAPEEYDHRIRAGYSSEDVILECFFDGQRCTHRNFTLLTDPNYGNCYSFNTDGSRMNSRRSGAPSGLSISYSSGFQEYLNFIQSAGVRVVITEQGKPVFPDAAGYNVLSGSRTSVSLRPTAIRAISTGRKPCAFTPGNIQYYYYDEGKYSMEACLRSCYQQGVIEQCHCGDPRIPLPSVNISACELVNRSCVNDNYDNMDGRSCQCPLECSLDQYDAVLTMSKRAHNCQVNAIMNTSSDTAWIDVYLETSTIMEYQEELAYTPSLLWWDFSNTAVTCTGCSVLIVFVKVIDSICGLAIEWYRRRKSRGQVTSERK